MATSGSREGSLEAPTRHPIDWNNPDFYNEESLNTELERVFDICHGCRRCVSLCNSFPTLFDLVDESDTMEVDGVDKNDYSKIVDHCYLCDLCYLTKCPYVPPHEWNVDFPHLMLRAKAIKFRKGNIKKRDKILSSTDTVGSLAGIPIVSQFVNSANGTKIGRKALEKTLGVHAEAKIPKYHAKTARKTLSKRALPIDMQAENKVALFITCYNNFNEPEIATDLVKVFEHNKISISIMEKENCCGMPKLELGDLEGVAKLKDANIPTMLKWIDEGWDIVAPVPSCVLMFKQELPLMFPDDKDVQRVKDHIFDPFEYLHKKHKNKQLKIDFSKSLGKVFYHASCHLRVQRIGLKTRDVLNLIPDTQLEVLERCSGHDGTYAVKKEFHEISMKICRPVVSKLQKAEANYYSSDCPMAGHQISNGMKDDSDATHPMTLLRIAYGL
ncbi:MAG: heterodisulfide reductase-related iron-sulfur binding cluster [Gammaproteobacteria bacterium]|nr:heterodisulfide reductase-related iron-sulfur binding cluster [Gammaproteobacteria bacterium]